uniref:ABC transporter domain-containing protein n=1 Tax=Glossina brevipalpis TaxID=37001 RepID=A0A1A9WA06_9MUSC
MRIFKAVFSPSQIQALLRKDILVRWRQLWLTCIQIIWPCVVFLLLYLMRLKFSSKHFESCQFPTRQLPTTHNTLPGFLTYICSLENRCSDTKDYEEYMKLEKAPLKPIVDIAQILINDDHMFQAIIDLPEKANFISVVTTLVTNSHFDEIRSHIEKVIDLMPEVEKMINGSFDIKKLFSDRKTFVKAGNLVCGYPFPNTETIPLVEDIIESQDFSIINNDELKAMPTDYCKRLYLDITSNNYGKITWETIKPIIHGKILYAPINEHTESIIKFANSTFVELDRLKMFSVTFQKILTKLRTDTDFQKGFDTLLNLASSPIVRTIIGDDFDIDQLKNAFSSLRTDQTIYDVVTTIKNILECLSVDRFVGVETDVELKRSAFDLSKTRTFYAGIYFNQTMGENIVYKLHMDVQNSQPTIENRNRFWFPGPAGDMIFDLKYHRGFVQIKQAVDLGIIKHKKKEQIELGVVTERSKTTPTTVSSFSIQINSNEDEDDDDWFTDVTEQDNSNVFTTTPSTLISSLVNGIKMNANDSESNTRLELIDDEETETTTLISSKKSRRKRQNLLDFFFGGGSPKDKNLQFEVDDLKFFTKQFPYPAHTVDDFKTGVYLAQAVQAGLFLGLVAQVAACVRHIIWMRESKNSMIMRSMGLKLCSELVSWSLITFAELFLIFLGVTTILYIGSILIYTSWIFVMVYLCISAACLIAFCFMCSTFFNSATIGAVASAVLFFITFCPYIIVLMFDAKLNTLQNFIINLSFTTAFAHGLDHIMRLEMQEMGLSFQIAFKEGLHGDYGFAIFMIILDMFIYIGIAYLYQRYKNDEYRFVEVQREDLDPGVGATLTNVSKIYQDNKIAVSNISLSFPRNQVTCLLGRNGAGKSTIIKMLTGQVVQNTGRVILSQAMSKNDDYDKVGVCSQDNILIPNLTTREHLEMYAKIKLQNGFAGEVEKTLKSLHFGQYENFQACQLSGGFQRRLCVAIAFLGSPNVVILDEPCNGVDAKARKDIWDLIERLRQGRAVIFATHFLDEAEHLSDNIVIMKNGKIIAKHNPETLMNHCTSYYEISLKCCDNHTLEDIVSNVDKMLINYRRLDEQKHESDLRLRISYDQQLRQSGEFLKYLYSLQIKDKIQELTVETESLEQLFNDLDKNSIGMIKQNGYSDGDCMKTISLKKEFGSELVCDAPLTRFEAMRELFWKRLVHFSRNYRMILSVLILPAVFEVCAMWFITQRLEDDYDKSLKLTRNLYPKSTEMLSMEVPNDFTKNIYSTLKQECDTDMPCQEFPNTKQAFYWILETLTEYREKRYGGYSFNESKTMVWYNNKGYHAMMAWLNDLNSQLLQVSVNDSNYSITTYNEPWKLNAAEFSTTSILRNAGDAFMAFILLVAFSLVVAVASVYLVNERVNGEKLQQKLCGIDAITYWSVAFIWDFLIILLAIIICSIIMLLFGMPVFTDRQQLWAVIVLAVFFGFACIPAVHVFEKCFMDSSVAIVTIFVLNVLIPLFTMIIIIVLGVVGDSPTWDSWRYFLNRAFLVFPQHALGDGLQEICKNFFVSLMFQRYDIDSYKNPINSDLLRPHLISLTVLGLFFIILNILLESGLFYRWHAKLCEQFDWIDGNERRHFEELKIVSIQNSLKRNDQSEQISALKVENLCKSYSKSQNAVSNITFSVKAGECFGLLGKNGAGKSTIFKILSGQLQPNVGHVEYYHPEISYCPQTNTLDSLLTVRECIEFYGRLRRITNISQLVTSILRCFQLESYRDVFVKNLSGGNRRKLTVATTCCGRTSVVLMDEPTSDMDPMTRAIVYRSIDHLLSENRAIILTSHSISEIDNICHRIAVLKKGRMLTCGSLEQLKHEYSGYYNVTLYGGSNDISIVEKKVRSKFLNAEDIRCYAHSLRFSIKIKENASVDEKKVKEHGIDVTDEVSVLPEILGKSNGHLRLDEIFNELTALTEEFSGSLRYAVNKCKLDAIFEKILIKSNDDRPYAIKSAAFEGTPSTGYIHNGYIETETVT